MSLTNDALVDKSWAGFKRRRRASPLWGVTRVGFSNQNWVVKWLEVLRAFNLPRTDFVILRPRLKFNGMTSAIATCDDASSALRSLLASPFVGLSVEQALEFTVHSWRHLYPTAARQLGMADGVTADIGHWSQNSAMPTSMIRRHVCTSCRGRNKFCWRCALGGGRWKQVCSH